MSAFFLGSLRPWRKLFLASHSLTQVKGPFSVKLASSIAPALQLKEYEESTNSNLTRIRSGLRPMMKGRYFLHRIKGSSRRWAKDVRRTFSINKNGVEARSPVSRSSSVPESTATAGGSGGKEKAKRKFSPLLWTVGFATIPIAGVAVKVLHLYSSSYVHMLKRNPDCMDWRVDSFNTKRRSWIPTDSVRSDQLFIAFFL